MISTVDVDAANVAQRFVSEFWNSKSSRKKYIMGRPSHGYAEELAKCVDVDGFIDDFANESQYQNKPILRHSEVSKDSLVLVCSTVRTVTAVKRLLAHGFLHVLDYNAFYFHSRDPRLKIRLIDKFPEEFQKHSSEFEWAKSLMHDDQSKKNFELLVRYRLTCDLLLMSGFSYSPEEQYFPEFLKISKEVFVDGGGCRGEVSLELIRRCPDWRSIYLFEPVAENVKIASSALSNFKNVSIFPIGLSDTEAVLGFDKSKGETSGHFAEAGADKMRVSTVDAVVQEAVTFLKLDVEGFESEAIMGAANHILRHHPALAVACYHKPNDLWSIPKLVLSIRSDYYVFLRHYTEGIDESIIYFVPENKLVKD